MFEENVRRKSRLVSTVLRKTLKPLFNKYKLYFYNKRKFTSLSMKYASQSDLKTQEMALTGVKMSGGNATPLEPS